MNSLLFNFFMNYLFKKATSLHTNEGRKLHLFYYNIYYLNTIFINGTKCLNFKGF
jgi:hypothetical protein